MASYTELMTSSSFLIASKKLLHASAEISFLAFLPGVSIERDMIIKRTQKGKAIAKTKIGFKEGRPQEFTQEQLGHAVRLLKTHSYRQVTANDKDKQVNLTAGETRN